jgi:uncharacterized protein involved in response to NO
MIPIREHQKPKPFSLFNLGFRPFFLGGALASAILMMGWLHLLASGSQVNYYPSTALWHGHEMLFGFALAIVAGFLLTAVKTWTNVQTPYGWPLAVIFLVWLLARIIIFIPAVPPWLVALVDLSFAPVLAFSIAVPVIRSQNYRNLIFVPLLSAFFVANLIFHAEIAGLIAGWFDKAMQLALSLIIMMIVIIGGRVIPFFTERGVPGVTCQRYPWIEKAIVPLMLIWIIGSLSGIAPLIVVLSLVLGVVSAVRSYGWFSQKVFRVPLVWVLHFGYLFIAVGFVLYALAHLELVPHSVALHAFTAGAIGTMTLGMMARVSLGHTGRSLEIPTCVKIAFIMMVLAAVIRICIQWLPMEYMTTLYISGALWIAAWALFLYRYTALLIKPRVDGLFG